MQGETGLFDSLGCIAPIGADEDAVLGEAGDVVDQALDTAGGEEADDIEALGDEQFTYIVADGTVHEGRGKLTAMRLQPVHDLVVLLIFRTGIQESFVLLMLVDDIEQRFVRTVRTEEYLSLAV